MKIAKYLVLLLLASFAAHAQPGPPNPWTQNGSAISPLSNTTCLTFPSGVTGGCKGPGTINATQLYSGGALVATVGGSVVSFSAGSTGLTPSTATMGAITLAGTLNAANGGTGIASYAIGDLLYASGSTTLAKLAGVATGNALISGGIATAPSWGKIGLTTHVSGTLPVGNGGTGITSYAVGDIIYASGTTTLAALADVATGNVLLSGGITTAPAWGKVSLTSAVSGTLPVGNGGIGVATLASNGVLYGNGTSAVQATAVGTTGQVLIGNTGAAPSWAALSSLGVTTFSAGTTGFTPSSATAGVVTLAGTLGVANGGTGTGTAFTSGAMVFAGASGVYTQDASNLFYSSTLHQLAIGSNSFGGSLLHIRSPLTSTATTGVLSESTGQSDITNTIIYFRSIASTQAAAYTLSSLVHFDATQGTIGAASAVTSQYGFFADSTLSGATSNFGFYGNIAAATNAWNLYMNGTAANYMAGPLGIGTNSFTAFSLRVAANITGATTAYAIGSGGTVQSDVTSSAHYFRTAAATQATSFTLGSLFHYKAEQGTFGAGSTVTSQYGYFVDTSMTGGTTNYAFYGNLAASGTARWNLYMNGSAANYFAGPLSMGTTSNTGYGLRVHNNITGSTNSRAVSATGTIQSDVTTAAYGFESQLATQATSFTLASLYHFRADQGTIGAGSTVTSQYGFRVESTLTGATNNYGFYSNIATAANRYNFYASGTAPNFFQGITTFATSAIFNGSSSGTITLQAPAAAGSNTVTLPAATLTLGTVTGSLVNGNVACQTTTGIQDCGVAPITSAAAYTYWGNNTGSSAAPSFISTTPANWTPADASGASLTLTVNSATYTKMGRICVIDFDITFPVTVDGTSTGINGIPAVCAAQSSNTGAANGIIGVTTGSVTTIVGPITMAINSSTTRFRMYWGNGSSSDVTNAEMSGVRFRGTMTIITGS